MYDKKMKGYSRLEHTSCNFTSLFHNVSILNAVTSNT